MPVVFFVSQPCVTTKLFENYFVTKVHVTDSICHFTHNNVTPFCNNQIHTQFQLPWTKKADTKYLSRLLFHLFYS